MFRSPKLSRRLRSLTVLATLVASLAVPSLAHADVQCHNWAIRGADGNFVSTEIGYSGVGNGLLRSRAATIGPWERYQICFYNGGQFFTMRSLANGRFVSAELGYGGGFTGSLRARATAVGPWEQFRAEGGLPAGYAIRSLANNTFVSAELGYTSFWYGTMRARATAVGSWERFHFYNA